MTPKDARALPSVAQADLRRKAIRAVRRGMKQTEAAELFGVHRGTLSRWMRSWKAQGARALKARKRGRPPGSRLLPHQAARIARLIIGRCPDQLKLPFALWTREAVGQLIATQFGIQVSVWTVGRYLKHWGFTPQKPLRRAYERDPQAVARWLAEQYPALRAQAKAARAEIHWGDEMGLRSDHQAGTSWGRRGRTPVIPGTGKRFKCNLISTLTNRGVLAFMVFEQRFTARVFVQFLRRLLRQRKRKVFLIVDSHPVHKSAKVDRWVAQQKGRIRLFFLPAYSPELNPDELLNQDVKTNAVGRQRPRKQAELLANVRGYLWSTQRQPAMVRNYFREEHVRYAA